MVGVASAFELSPLCTVVRGDEPGSARVLAGDGRQRTKLDVDGEALVRWLLARTPDVREHLEPSLADDLGIDDGEDVAALFDALVDARILIPTESAGTLREIGADWERHGWRDAFDFHWSSWGARFDYLPPAEYRALAERWIAEPGEAGEQPPAFRVRRGDVQPLTESDAKTSSVAEALLTNRPINYYLDAGVNAADLTALLHSAFGVQKRLDLAFGPSFTRSFPSGGARHPIEVYVAALDVNDLGCGVYRYDLDKGEFEVIRRSLSRDELVAVGFGKRGAETASALLLISVRWIRHIWKYRYSRSYRMVLMEVGHAVQAARAYGSAIGLDVYYSPAVDSVAAARLLEFGDEAEEGAMCVLGLGREGVI